MPQKDSPVPFKSDWKVTADHTATLQAEHGMTCTPLAKRGDGAKLNYTELKRQTCQLNHTSLKRVQDALGGLTLGLWEQPV